MATTEDSVNLLLPYETTQHCKTHSKKVSCFPGASVGLRAIAFSTLMCKLVRVESLGIVPLPIASTFYRPSTGLIAE